MMHGQSNIDHNYFRSIQGVINSENEQDIVREERRLQFADEFEESMGLYRNVLRNGKPQDFIFKSTQERNQFIIFPRPGEEANIGDIILWNDMHWLVKYKNFNDILFASATIVCCNRQISWQNDAGEIISRWCLATKPYTSNITEGNTLTQLNGRYDIELPYDEETIAVPIGKRFMLDIIGGHPMCYKLVFSDANTNKYQDSVGGFIEWNLESDEYQKDNDSVSLMLCNYIEPRQDEIKTDKIKAVVSGRNEIKLGGSRRYSVLFIKPDGTFLSEEVPTVSWRLDIDEKLSKYIHIDVDGNSCIVSCDNNERLIGISFNLVPECDSNVYECIDFEIKVVSAFG